MDERKVTATKADFDELAEDLRQTIMDLKLSVTTRIGEFEQRIDQQFGDVANRLLTTVFQLAEALQSRVTEVERSDANVKHRLAMLEERLTELEKRLTLAGQQRVQ
jgi:predicted  nucleic acid-binding Zn-ribbon protein